MRYKNLQEENFILKTILIILGLIISFALGNLLDASEYEVEAKEFEMYATMVCLSRETDGQYGWPNYKKLDITCKEEL